MTDDSFEGPQGASGIDMIDSRLARAFDGWWVEATDDDTDTSFHELTIAYRTDDGFYVTWPDPEYENISAIAPLSLGQLMLLKMAIEVEITGHLADRDAEDTTQASEPTEP
jgi:hypothetical protein